MNKLLNRYLNVKHLIPECYNFLRRYAIFRILCRMIRYTAINKLYTLSKASENRKKKYICALPWEKAAVKADGRVTCSTFHRSRDELFFGNINEESFSEIWYGDRFQKLRNSIRESDSPLPFLCYTCPYKIESNGVSELPLKPDFPKVLWVESTDACNLNCPDCLYRKDRSGAKLSLESFQKMMDEIGQYLSTVLFYIDGENYLHPEAMEMTRYAKQVNPELQILTSTNGLLFCETESQEDFVRSGVDSVIFSIDGANQESYSRYRKGGNFATALNNMRGVIEQKQRLGIKLDVIWRYILFKWNDSDEEMDLARSIASDIGVDSLTWLITTTVNHSERFLPGLISSYKAKLHNERFEATETASQELAHNSVYA